MTQKELFKYQPEAMKLLKNAYLKDKLVHAYLLDGEVGSGIIEAAIYMAKLLLCKNDNAPCMECNDCTRIDNNSHLNFIHIVPVSEMIKKEQIEKLIHDFSMTSLENGSQIYIIEDADKMNTSAANSLLKFLEEPNPNHYAFLTTNNHRRMLDTIVSRCQMIHFKPIPKEYLLETLVSCGVEKDMAYITTFLTTDKNIALRYIEDGKIINFLNVAKKIIEKNIKNKDTYVEYYRNRNILLEEKDKSYHRLFLDILALIYQELLNKITNGQEKYFSDILKDVKIDNIKKEDIIRKLECINMYQERFNYYVNLDLQYASLFSKL